MSVLKNILLLSISESFLEKEEHTENSLHTSDDDRMSGIQLYGRFHSYYSTHISEEADLEAVHMKILRKLNDFAATFE